MVPANLTQLERGKIYRVFGFLDNTSTYSSKLYKMGFTEGTPLQLAPVKMSDPIVIEIRGSRIALRKSEASHVLVEEVSHA